VGREGYALLAEIDGAAKADAAALEGQLALHSRAIPDNLLEHPITRALAIGGPRFTAIILSPSKRATANLVPPMSTARVFIDWAAAAKTSAGKAVPVPFFMMVTDATRLRNVPLRRGARDRQRQGRTAEKLSPAPQISTGFEIGSFRITCFHL